MKILEINIEQYEKFNQTIKSYNLFQTSSITETRKYNYEEIKYLGLIDNQQKIYATTQLLIETIPYIKKKMGTSIKGINIDFNNQEILNIFNQEMKKYLKKNNFLLYRTDLSIAYKLYNNEFEKLSEEEIKFPNYDPDIKTKLIKAKFKNFSVDKNYTGRSPQWSMLVETTSEEIIKKQYNRSVKRGIKTAQKYGLMPAKVEKTEDNIKIFYELHQKNAQKNQIQIMNYEYYKKLISSEHIDLYLVKINKIIFQEEALKEYEKKQNHKTEDILKLANNYEGEYILGHITGFYNDIAYDMFTGLNYDYKDLGTKEILMNEILMDCVQKKIKWYDFWGILGDKEEKKHPMYPIYLFKKKFSNLIVEYPGFWDIYTNKVIYIIFNSYLKYQYKKKH